MLDTARQPLTERQAAILGFIVAFRQEHGFSPSFREIMTHFGMSSPTGVACHLRALARKGYLRLERMRSRALLPIDEDGAVIPAPVAVSSAERPSLTGPQAAALEEIRASIAARGYSPTIREICAAMGFASPNAALGLLRKLEAAGYVRHTAGTARGIAVV